MRPRDGRLEKASKASRPSGAYKQAGLKLKTALLAVFVVLTIAFALVSVDESYFGVSPTRTTTSYSRPPSSQGRRPLPHSRPASSTT